MIREVGTLATIETLVRDADGDLVNTPTLTVSATAPDGTFSAPAVTNTTTGGRYTAPLQLTQAGVWRWTWTSSGTIVATQSDQLTAVSTQRALIASRAELKKQLNRTDVTDDDELSTYLAAATDWVEYELGGPIVPTTYTEVYCTDGDIIVPKRRPLVSVTSITPYLGAALDASSGYRVDTDLNVVFLRYRAGREYTMVYRAGLSTILERYKLAGLIVAQHLWQVENGGGGLPFPGEGETTFVAGVGFAVPNRAKELLPDAVSGIA